jgi:hypothetical protein
MTITQACGYVTTSARKAIVQATIDQTGRRSAIQAIIDTLHNARYHALLERIRKDSKTPPAERAAIENEIIRDIAIRQQYDQDDDFADAVNTNLR